MSEEEATGEIGESPAEIKQDGISRLMRAEKEAAKKIKGEEHEITPQDEKEIERYLGIIETSIKTVIIHNSPGFSQAVFTEGSGFEKAPPAIRKELAKRLGAEEFPGRELKAISSSDPGHDRKIWEAPTGMPNLIYIKKTRKPHPGEVAFGDHLFRGQILTDEEYKYTNPHYIAPASDKMK